MLGRLKEILGDIGLSDDVLLTYIEIAQRAILDRLYPFEERFDLPLRYEPRVINIACYLVNKRGAEGQLTHNENGITRSYASGDIPESMLRDIQPHATFMYWS